ncbi:MAG: dephospho-CoA kinase [Myxococcota bacterium]
MRGVLCYVTRMRVIGLTGGIASGKSTVRRRLEEHDVRVLDADAVYHELITSKNGEPSPLAHSVGERFPGVLADDGNLDREALGRVVFTGTLANENRRALEAITHPAVAQEVGRRTQALRESGCPLVIYDVPLLYERRLETGMDGVIVVWVPEALQIERLMARDGIGEDDARLRLGSQLPLDEKKRRATWVIDNSGDLVSTRERVDALWHRVIAGD